MVSVPPPRAPVTPLLRVLAYNSRSSDLLTLGSIPAWYSNMNMKPTGHVTMDGMSLPTARAMMIGRKRRLIMHALSHPPPSPYISAVLGYKRD